MNDADAWPPHSFRHKVSAPGPKRLLALDGGGIRGLITIEILGRLEAQLREARGGDPNFVLSDFFDYVGGTSTGAIIAAGISLGMPIATLRDFYLRGAKAMFSRASIFRRWHYRNLDTTLSEKLREVVGHDRELGDPDLRTLLLLVMKNATTDSPWPLSNNPHARYNAPEQDGCNSKLPLWQLIRASTAAPTYFPPAVVQVGTQKFVFVDGAVSVYNNPAFILFLMATLPEYRLGWPAGEEKLLLVSIGTGLIGQASANLRPSQMTLLYNARKIPAALIDAALIEQDMLCRVFGRCRFGESIDGEIGDLIEREAGQLANASSAFTPKKFTYVRYNPVLTREGLDALGLTDVAETAVQPLDSPDHLAELQRVGEAYARNVRLADLGPFDPTRGGA
jgi:uncharacterized protein